MKLVAMTGATGYVGRFVVAALQRQGCHIRALSRPSADHSGFSAPLDWVIGDLRTPAALHRLVAGAEALVHLAYEHVPGLYRKGEGDDLSGWLDANLTGSLNLLQAAQQAGVQQVIFLSSRAVFSHTEPDLSLDERHPAAPDTHYGAYKAAVEAFLHSFAHTGGMRTCSIRATGIYGLTHPVERSKWWDIIQAVVRGEPVQTNRGGTEVHGGDAARVVSALLARPDLGIHTLHLSDLYVSTRDIVRLAQAYAGLPSALPPPAPPPENVMESRYLDRLGVRLGGEALLRQTVEELVDAAQAHASD